MQDFEIKIVLILLAAMVGDAHTGVKLSRFLLFSSAESSMLTPKIIMPVERTMYRQKLDINIIDSSMIQTIIPVIMMIKSLLFLCFVAASCCAVQAQGKTANELIKILEAPQTSRKARIDAARKLARKPPAEVLPKLLLVSRKYGDSIADWGLDAFRAGHKVSWEQAAAMSAGYAWSWNLNNPAYTKQEKGAALLDLLKRENTVSAKAGFLYDLKFYWIDGAEAEAAAILVNPKAAPRSRYVAADVLLGITNMKYYGEAYSAALDADLEYKEWFTRLLLSKRASEWKARVLRYAFDVIQALRAAYPDRLNYGYHIASSLEGYVGAKFVPNQADPKYQGKYALKDIFFIETVDNALKWWENNKSAYSQ